MSESTCIIDFCGNDRCPGHWCDYFPDRKVTTFGGAWGVVGVPDMPSDNEPSEDTCEAWVKQHAPNWIKDYWTLYLANA